MKSTTREDLASFRPRHDAFVGVDSDGCVFDTMEAKQKRCFHGLIVSHWQLEPIDALVRETAEFVNLYSRSRGQNRFTALLRTFELLARRPEVTAAGVTVPALPALRALVASGVALGNPALAETAARTGDGELAAVLAWSEAVNGAVAREVPTAPAFPLVRESLELIAGAADVVCVSQTPAEALEREWAEHGFTPYVAMIAGQELGTKAEHLALATDGRYAPQRVMMLGDAPGDLAAAREVGALFYPICPTREAASWERFHDEAFARFLAGTYAGVYERQRVSEFEALLPESPPWPLH